MSKQTPIDLKELGSRKDGGVPHQAGPAAPLRRDLSGLVDAVVFDCYGTLIDVDEHHFVEVAGAICAENGLSISGKEFWERWLVENRRLSRERGVDGSEPGAQIDHPEPPFFPLRTLWGQVFERTFPAFECSGNIDAANARMRDLLYLANAYPETAEVLEALGASYRLALLSNADEDHLDICLSRNGINFETRISSEAAASYKPHPAIFRRVVELLDLPAERILYVGDSPIADVRGAHAAGMAVAWVNRLGIALPEGVPQPDLEIRDLRGLLPALLPATGAGV